jgi:hypothetical protein
MSCFHDFIRPDYLQKIISFVHISRYLVKNTCLFFSRYKQLLSDCHQCYFSQRETLLGPSVSAAVAELATKHSRDHCALVSQLT